MYQTIDQFIVTTLTDLIMICFGTGLLLSSLEKNGFKIRVVKNPFEIGRSIRWKMEVPDDIAQELSSLNDVCDMVMHISFVHF